MMRSLRIDRRTTSRTTPVRARTLASVSVLALAWTVVATAHASEQPATTAKAPAVSTGAGRASGTGVVLEGTIDPRGEATTYYFQYGPTSAYIAQTPSASLPAGPVRVRVTQTVIGLASGYHYRLVATNGGGTGYGLDHTYTAKTTKTTKTTKKTGLKFTLVSPPAEGEVVGSPVTIQGALSGPGAVGRQVVLQSSPYPSGAIFTNVTPPQTITATGRFAFFLAHLSRSARFRVATVDVQPTYSPVIVELATVRVTLRLRAAPRAGLVRLYGTVSPAATGAIAYFQLQEATKPPKFKIFKSEKAEERAEERAEIPRFSTQFSAPVKRATKSVSRFSVVVRIRKTGLYRAYVQVPRGPLASGYSTSVLLHASAKPKKSKKG